METPFLYIGGWTGFKLINATTPETIIPYTRIYALFFFSLSLLFFVEFEKKGEP
jgi:hypothetical protein